MKKLYRKSLSLWFKISRPIRFLLVGGFNTTVSFVLFGILIYFQTPYALALIICYAVGINLSVQTMKTFVYQSRQTAWPEYARGWLVYLSAYAVNYIFLYVCIDVFNLGAIFSQAFYTVISSFILYKLHKYFTFKQTQ